MRFALVYICSLVPFYCARQGKGGVERALALCRYFCDGIGSGSMRHSAFVARGGEIGRALLCGDLYRIGCRPAAAFL